ncbi:hypothetical protein EST38_g9301 [Candolleomyces aberdarensis]|uniref:Uncharacterized protein n=1 Tax=Candolleomyces aberdarensis TaxID=2316362 RepID=A0A4Q2DDI0_9AGAR|nr:hypothetical protein EST38_g9301 [Candolleomyces aberdarensis]
MNSQYNVEENKALLRTLYKEDASSVQEDVPSAAMFDLDHAKFKSVRHPPSSRLMEPKSGGEEEQLLKVYGVLCSYWLPQY